MILLHDLKKGSKAVILTINSDTLLKDRLKSFGVKVGSRIVVKEFSINKSTMSIQAGKTILALRSEEAKKIEVEIE